MDSKQTTPYSFVILRPRCNPRITARLKAAGIPHHMRTAERAEAIVQRHATEAEAHGRDAWRANRVDTTGRRQSDSGVPIFGWDGTQYEATNLKSMREDLVKAGYVLVSANLDEKEGDNGMSFLYLRFEPVATGTPAVMSAEANQAIDSLLAKSWHKNRGFRNPNGSCTVNISNIVTREELAKVSDARTMRMSTDGRFRNEKTDVPTPEPRPASTPRQPPTPLQYKFFTWSGEEPRFEIAQAVEDLCGDDRLGKEWKVETGADFDCVIIMQSGGSQAAAQAAFDTMEWAKKPEGSTLVYVPTAPAPQPQRSPRQPPPGWRDPNRGGSTGTPRPKPTPRW